MRITTTTTITTTTQPNVMALFWMALVLMTTFHMTTTAFTTPCPTKAKFGQISAAVAAVQTTRVISAGSTSALRTQLFSSTKVNGDDTPSSMTFETKNDNMNNNNPNATQMMMMLSPLLNDALADQPNAAVTLLDTIDEMRRSGSPRQDIESYVDHLLSSGPDSSSLPFWSNLRPLTRFSRRARLAMLRRTLDLTTPPPSEDENSEMTKMQRRRRALLSLLRDIGKQQSSSSNSDDDTSSKNKAAIVTIYLQAKQMSKRISAAELKSRMPEGLESPKYTVLASRAGATPVEIRRYAPYSLCSVSMNKARPVDSSRTDATLQMPQMSGASSFGALAGYLFGKNDQSTAMKMTTPVFTANVDAVDEEEQKKQMSFVLPSQYWDQDRLAEAPQPLSGSGVTLETIPSQDRAVLLFGGFASQKEVDLRKKALLTTLQKDFSEWQALSEDITVAQYNDPFTAPWRRLNEVSVPVVGVAVASL
jgi:hypothetical protein